MTRWLILAIALLALLVFGAGPVRNGMYRTPQIVSVELVGGELHVAWRQQSDMQLDSYPSRPAPDNVWKDIYGAVDGEVRLVRTVRGTHIPRTPERFVFP